MQQASQLVSHIDHHDLLASAGQSGDLALDGLGHARVDGTTESTVRSHANEQMLGSLVLRCFDVGLLVKGWRADRKQWNLSPLPKDLNTIKSKSLFISSER